MPPASWSGFVLSGPAPSASPTIRRFVLSGMLAHAA